MQIIQSPLYLSGNKRELFPSIQPHLQGGKVLVEPFAGTATVALNCEARSMFEEYWLNDIQEEMVNLHKSLLSSEWIMKTYEENKKYPDSREAFDQLKLDFNSDLTRMDLLYLIMMRSHSNSIRFNKKRECNITHGKRERFDIEKMFKYKDLAGKFEWTTLGFAAFLLKVKKRVLSGEYNWEDVVLYIDPPYSQTDAHYMGAWTSQQDEILLGLMEEFQQLGAKVVYSNVFHNRGKTNQWLIDWAEQNNDKFETIYMDRDYSNCSSFKSDKPTVEVLLVSKEK